jgi:polysaccharide export outer membrane protein
MKKLIYITLSISLIFSLLLGCSSSDKKPEEEDFDQVKELEIKEFILGVGDSISISVFQHDELKKAVNIDSSGIVMMPLIGDVKVTERSIFELRDELQEKYSKYIVDPQVMISIAEIKSKKIMVMGEVKSPGVFTLEYDLRISGAIARAGGINEAGQTDNILLIRRKKGKDVEVTHLDFKKVYKKGEVQFDKVLRNGDIIYVPPKMIAVTARFMAYIGAMVSPLTDIETGIVLWPRVKEVIKGDPSPDTTIVTQ